MTPIERVNVALERVELIDDTTMMWKVFIRLGGLMTTREIAINLQRSPKTIEAYIASLKEQLELNSKQELDACAVLYVYLQASKKGVEHAVVYRD